MAKKKGGTLRFTYGIFLSVLTVFVGVLFIIQTWSIYRSAPAQPYTVENISAHFAKIALPVWILVGAVLLNVILALVFPETEKKPKATADVNAALARTKKRLPTAEEYQAEVGEVEYQHARFRRTTYLVSAAVMLLLTAAWLAVMLNLFYIPVMKGEFFASHNAVADRLVQTCVLALLSLSVGCVAVVLATKNKKKEQKAYLELIARSKLPKEEPESELPPVEESAMEEPVEVTSERWNGVLRSIVGMHFLNEPITQEEIDEQIRLVLMPPSPVEEPAPPTKKKRERKEKIHLPKPPKKEKKESPKASKLWTVAFRVGLGLAGVALVVVGIFNGGMRDVFLKAVNICTQCIGLG